MTDFIWPSDQARAENDELNRVCEYLEEVLGERDALAAHVGVVHQHFENREELNPATWAVRGMKLMQEAPTTSLTRQKLLWQAEAVETAVARGYRSRDELAGWAEHLRRQAEGDVNG